MICCSCIKNPSELILDKETVWQENKVADADATLALEVEVKFELEMLFTRVSRFWICS
jgi:hypothetical protein